MVSAPCRRARALLVAGLAALSQPVLAQHRADSITISRRAHDAAQAALGAAVTLGLDRLGAPPWLSCTLGPSAWPTLRFLAKRVRWTRREWPWSVAWRDWAWEVVLGSVAVPLVLGARDRTLGIGLGAGWVSLTVALDQLKWGSP